MKTKLLFLYCLFFFFSGCSRHQSHFSDDTKHQRAKSLATKCHETECAITFRNAVKTMFPFDDRFYLSYEEKDVCSLSEKSPLPYSGINVTVHFPPLKPNFQYILYCPFTGCPESPEVCIEIKTDDEGNVVPAAMFDKLKEHNIRINPIYVILLYANPGYCSDWYLMTTNPFSSLHTTFTYKPLVVSAADGRTVILNKKEPGGNILELVMKNFPPHKQVIINSCSVGNTRTELITVGENGSYDFAIAPPVPGFTKGVDHITIFSDEHTLEVSCEWNTSILDIKRVSTPSDVWFFIQSFAEKINDTKKTPKPFSLFEHQRHLP